VKGFKDNFITIRFDQIKDNVSEIEFEIVLLDISDSSKVFYADFFPEINGLDRIFFALACSLTSDVVSQQSTDKLDFFII